MSMDIAYENTQEYFMEQYNLYLSSRQKDDHFEMSFCTNKRYENMNLYGLNFTRLNFSQIEFVNCAFYDCIFDMTIFYACEFKGNIVFKRCSCKRLDFNRCDFKSALFSDCMFKKLYINDNDFGRSIFCNNCFNGINVNIAQSPEEKLKNSESFKQSKFIDNIFESEVYSIFPNLIPGLQSICPEDGVFIGWKKGIIEDKEGVKSQVLIKLLIPEDAKRSSANGRKCRCDKAEVLSITSLDGKEDYKKANSIHTGENFYEIGETVYADSFDENRLVECSNGIHFFLTKQEAIDY